MCINSEAQLFYSGAIFECDSPAPRDVLKMPTAFPCVGVVLHGEIQGLL